MAESIVTTITNNLTSVIPAEIIIFIVSLLPILELRGGLIAASLLKVNWLYAFPICIIEIYCRCRLYCCLLIKYLRF